MRATEIETFRAIMSSGSTRKAATLLGVTQPAVSQSLKRLEAEAGFELFQRLGGRLNPTPEARALLMAGNARRLLAAPQFGRNTLS